MADKKRILNRYSFVVFIIVLLGIGIVAKAGIIMFGERQYWLKVAERFVKEDMTEESNRGNILSADGSMMASSLPKYRIYMDFKAGGTAKDTMLMNHLNEICAGLHKIFPDKSAAYFKTHLLEGRKKGDRNYLIYPDYISYTQYKEAKRLPVFSLNKYKGGFNEQKFNQRKKPFGSLASRTLGDVYADTAQGAKNGIELAFDSILKGRDGIKHRQKVKNKWLDIIDVAPVNGCDVISTIDVDIQDICEKALVDKLIEINGYEGVVVLMEVATGEVKAIVNMTKGKDGKYSEVKNCAISDMMEPGSTFKTASLMVALEDGVISTSDGVDTGNGVMPMHSRQMYDHNWRRGGYQYLTVPEILMYSSNIGVSYLIDKHYGKNPDKFVEGLYRMSLNEPLNLQIPGEGKPYIRRPKDGGWSKTTLPWMSIGYETQIPPINTLAFYNAIANNGKMVRPKFVKAIARNGEVIKEFPTEVINPSICSKHTLHQIQDILVQVVNKGLAKPAGSPQFPVAGKTGTAQISQGAAGYKSNTVNYLVSFCGYFPADKPKYSCIIAIKKSGLPASGGLMAGSVFGKIAERVYAKNLVLDISNAIDPDDIVIPGVKAGELIEAKRVLDDLNITTRIDFKSKKDREIWGSTHALPTAVTLHAKEVHKNNVPSVIGMGAKDAVYLLESKGLKVHLSGVGTVRKQSIPQGSKINRGQTIRIELML